MEHYHRRVVHQSLAGAALAGGTDTPGWAFEWCETGIDLEDLGWGFGWKTARSIAWTVTPLALAAGERAQLAWCLVGSYSGNPGSPPLPLWWGKVADREAREAMDRVLELLDERGSTRAVFRPLVALTDAIRFRGSSLGLPLYLAAWGVSRGIGPRRLLATGRLDRRGGLHPVGHLDVKARLASREGFEGFIRPADGVLLTLNRPGLEILEVEDLEQAEFLWEAFSSGCGSRLLHALRSLDDPVWLASNTHLVRREVLRWRGAEPRLARCLEAVLKSDDLAQRWIDTVERMVNNPETDMECLGKTLAPVNPEAVLELGSRRARAAFRLTQVQVSFHNHRGDVEGSRRWIDVGRALLPILMVHEDAPHLEEAAVNRRFILERHNRYDFRPDIPPDVHETLAELTAAHEARRRRKPGSVSPALGRLLGTLAQNWGFCGPDHLPATLETAARARDAFGDGEVPEYRGDCLRQLCYEGYALLDARRHDEAEKVLTDYLGQPPHTVNGDRLRRMGPYQHALLARFLADTGREPGGDWLRWARSRSGARLDEHPWQLWLLNAGFLVRDPGDREEFWTRAAASCLALAETGQVMALMPLSELWSAGLGVEERIEEQASAVLGILRSSSLNLDHFRKVLDAPDWRTALETARRSRERLFPFSYR
jgi:hypothetical protein